MMRLCTKCNVSKPLADFHKDRNSKSGVVTWCKLCTRAYLRARYQSLSPAAKAAKRALEQERQKDPKVITKRRAALLRRYHNDPEYRAKHNADIRTRNMRPETREKRRRYALADRQNNRSKWTVYTRAHHLKKKYGITIAQYDTMLAAQNGKCALCGTDSPKGRGTWHVDHCHDSKAVRGLLCSRCNVQLGVYQKLKAKVGEANILSYLQGTQDEAPEVQLHVSLDLRDLPKTEFPQICSAGYSIPRDDSDEVGFGSA